MNEVTVVEDNNDLDGLDLGQVTEQVISYKKNIETSIYEIGKRLKSGLLINHKITENISYLFY